MTVGRQAAQQVSNNGYQYALGISLLINYLQKATMDFIPMLGGSSSLPAHSRILWLTVSASETMSYRHLHKVIKVLQRV